MMYIGDVYSVFAVTPKNKLWVEKKRRSMLLVATCLLEIKEISGTEKGNNFFFFSDI